MSKKRLSHKRTQKQSVTKSPTPAQISKAKVENDRGIAFAQQDEFKKAIACFERAIRFTPQDSMAYSHLGIVFVRQNKFDKAAEYYQRALILNPHNAFAHYNLGNLFQKQAELDKAVGAYQEAIALNNHYPQMHLNLGNVFREQGELDQAIDCYQRALSLNPDYVDAHNNLGDLLIEDGKLVEAGNHLQEALALNPKYGETLYNLGKLREAQGQMDNALVCWQRALELMKPDDANRYFKVGYMFQKRDRFTEAMNHFRQALALEPKHFDAHTNLAGVLKSLGMINDAITHFKQALEIKPTSIAAHHSLLWTLNYSDHDQAAIFLEHQRFNEQHALPLAASISAHLNDREPPQRRLKIGYVSGDFRRHSVAFFIREILAHHNHEQFEIVCYYNDRKVDKITRQLQAYADSWVDCIDLSDDKLADKIRADQIDILVDLAGHTAGNRLLVFAMKPAPIQVSYLGYPNTTGLTAIDYRITDNYADPKGIADHFNSEVSIRTPNSYFCFCPNNDCPDVNPLPLFQKNYITFGSFNNYAKINSTILSIWTEILCQVPDSKLMIKTKAMNDQTVRQELENKLAHFGIEAERLILLGPIPSLKKALQTYHQVDIGLDPSPFNGATTTCEALWMGIPVVTLVGKTHSSRMGLSILSTLGLTELIAYTSEQYVDICLKLANDTDYLQQLRASMRERMLASPLMDYVNFTACLEGEYRKMWETWCR